MKPLMDPTHGTNCDQSTNNITFTDAVLHPLDARTPTPRAVSVIDLTGEEEAPSNVEVLPTPPQISSRPVRGSKLFTPFSDYKKYMRENYEVFGDQPPQATRKRARERDGPADPEAPQAKRTRASEGIGSDKSVTSHDVQVGPLVTYGSCANSK